MKILVADDDRTSRLVMRRMLLASGYEVLTTENGPETVAQVLGPDGPRLVLLDWMMPGMSGPEVCRAIRSAEGATDAGAYVYVILLTARDSKDDLVVGLEAGADDYITKPCYPEELRARLRTGVRILELQESLIQARDEMQFRATHDALTHLLNRGAAVHALAAAQAAAATRGEEVSVLLGDVDHFKSINDTHGHPVGDEVLREVSRRIRHAMAATAPTAAGAGLPPGREPDVAGRFGGEEFLLVLRHTDAARLVQRAEAIRLAIAQTPVQTTAGPVPVTMSLGALALDRGPAKAIDDVLRRTDLLLYKAKRTGRNRVVCAAEAGAYAAAEMRPAA